MLELCHLHAGYPGKQVLTDLSAALPEGTLTAVVGPNGCGKSTLLKAISGLIPYSGEVLYQNRAIHALSPGERAKLLSFLPQTRPIPAITAEKLVLHGRFPYLSYPRRYRKEDLTAAQNAMAQLGIARLSHRYLPDLSGGERQSVYIAMVLAQETPVILMDEPTSFLDISHRFEIIRSARALARQGKTVIAVLHDLDLALRYADQLLLMEKGKAILCSPAEAALRSGLLEAVFHIRIGTAATPDGPQYYFSPESL